MKNKKAMVFALILVPFILISFYLGFSFYRNQWRDGTYYLIDEHGERVSDKSYKKGGLQYDPAFGLAEVVVENGWPEGTSRYKESMALVNSSGDFVIKPGEINGYPSYVGDGKAFLPGINPRIIDSKGDTVAQLKGVTRVGKFTAATLAPFVTNKETARAGYINENGDIVLEPVYDDALEFADNGLAAVKDPVTLLWGYINAKGEYCFAPQFEYAGTFSDGLAPVRMTGDRAYYIDMEGNTVIDNGYVLCGEFDNGLAIVKKADESFVIIDTAGNELTAKGYKRIEPFSNGYAAFQDSNGKWGYLDGNGNVTIAAQFEAAAGFSANDSAPVKADSGLWGYIRGDGSWLIEPKYSFAGSFDSASGTAVVAE